MKPATKQIQPTIPLEDYNNLMALKEVTMPNDKFSKFVGAIFKQVIEHNADKIPAPPPTTKMCTICEKEHPLEDFNKSGSTVDGLHLYCRPCHKDYNKRLRAIRAQEMQVLENMERLETLKREQLEQEQLEQENQVNQTEQEQSFKVELTFSYTNPTSFGINL